MADSLTLPYLVPTQAAHSGKGKRIAGGSDVTGRHGHSRDPFPIHKQNGHVASRETLPEQHLTYYHNEAGSRVRAEPPPRQYKRRLQSLPSRKPKAADDSPRQTNSAPSKKGNKASVAPLPKLNNLMAKLRTSEREQTYGRHWTNDHAGVSTKGHDAQNQRSQKFATSWAHARAEQANLRRDHYSAEDKKKPEGKKSELSPQEPSNPDDKRKQEVAAHDTDTKERDHVRRKNEQTLSHMFHASDNRENHSPNQDNHRKKNDSPYLYLKLKNDKEKRSREKRRNWNPSYVVEKPVVISPRRQEAELTHHPAITESDEVYKAYTGVTKRELRRGDDSVSRVFSQYGDVYNATITVSPRNKKEYVLTLREAEAYKKINSVYGEDGIRRKRKSLLIQKLVTVEIDQMQQHNQMIRERERKRAESKRRQQKQLNYIRKRFKNQQSRRFRSQYVTSRVLEHEKMNRNEFGLPEEEYEDDRGEDGASDMNSEKSASKKRGEEKQIDRRKKKKAYEKKFKNMFDIKVGPAWDPRPKTPKMEGVDIVTVEIKDKEGNVKEEKKEVKDIMKDAKKLLKSSNKDISLSEDESRTTTPPRKSQQPSRRKPSLDSLDFEDDDDDDIFERARRKYNLDVDSNV